jgi:hypothetical protein
MRSLVAVFVLAAPAFADDVTRRGAPVPAGTAKTIGEVLADADKLAGKTVLVDGKIRAACRRKGCWMELATGPDAPGVRVTFKDYGFFVPTDSAGMTARAAGVLEVRRVPPEEAEHLRGEGAKLPVAADGSAREVRLIATGVELRK